MKKQFLNLLFYLFLLLFFILLIFYICNGLEVCVKIPHVSTIGNKQKLLKDKDFSNENFKIENLNSGNFSNTCYSKVKKRYAYESLGTDKEKEIYNLMGKKVYNISKNKNDAGLYEIEPIRIKGEIIEKNTIKKVFKAFQQDNPNVFWLANSVGIVKGKNETQIKLKSVICPEECEKLSKNLKEELGKIIKCLPKNTSEYARELFLHDLIIKRCKYEPKMEDGKAWRKFTIIGAILDGKAVCEGFSKAMKLLLNEVGIECRVITGARGEESHMWNLVKINGDWYHLDVTWDEPSEIGRYNYFNLNDKSIKFDHKTDRELTKNEYLFKNDKYNFKLPRCISIAENYFYRNALRLDLFNKETDNYIIDNLKDAVNRKVKYIYILVSEKMNFDDAVNQLFLAEPYKFFYYLSEVEKEPDVRNRVDKHRVYFLPNKSVNAISIEVNYV